MTARAAKSADKATLQVKLVRSIAGTRESHRDDGARPRPAQGQQPVSTLEDTPAVRGMINKVSYLVQVL